jgi:hypothetical protein
MSKSALVQTLGNTQRLVYSADSLTTFEIGGTLEIDTEALQIITLRLAQSVEVGVRSRYSVELFNALQVIAESIDNDIQVRPDDEDLELAAQGRHSAAIELQ